MMQNDVENANIHMFMFSSYFGLAAKFTENKIVGYTKKSVVTQRSAFTPSSTICPKPQYKNKFLTVK